MDFIETTQAEWTSLIIVDLKKEVKLSFCIEYYKLKAEKVGDLH